MTPRRPPSLARQSGAALLMAMLTVTLVATFAAAALWQQWRAVEVESAERARVQSAWVLVGALDWARLILREDGRTAGADYLAEPWAVPLEEARLSSFLSAEKNVASDSLEGLPDAFLSGRIVDAQSKLNVLSLIEGNKPAPAAAAAFAKLFDLLGLPAGELSLLTIGVQRATAGIAPVTPAATTGAAAASATPTPTPTATASDSSETSSTAAPLMPQHVAQLVWFGLSPQTVAALEPYVTVLPVRTPLNINTASAEAIFASVPALDLASAKRLVAQRTRNHFRSLTDTSSVLRDQAGAFDSQRHSVSTNYFEVVGRLRLDKTWVEEHSLLRRDGITVTTIWRERGAGATLPAPNP
ncbi:type II secretion system minor pseudopilin GspK [Variovorax sp. J22G21]|uniref:type II secretion system minor pseudopilin GspK n=1 Tax=Variovorax fucosicus TaxID=3053517 RepID=UPI0025773AF9|nr:MULTISPECIES: type II secretion system minor pseudopilin GspK [unclassified Variovorax]MDM0038277.1 type II secretion system minor pseudopilin GspK [Variovorax sp. J22R193]MDM0056054.1 type II secretion system minor pseudopilin GspK [Variovorax sp. J22G47]MDM0063053.1 type II secretion system minor pseudopilin GspK [Variovorax sp. J22G21]